MTVTRTVIDFLFRLCWDKFDLKTKLVRDSSLSLLCYLFFFYYPWSGLGLCIRKCGRRHCFTHKPLIYSVATIISIFLPTDFRNRLLDRLRGCPFSGATARWTRRQTYIHHHLDPNSRIQQRARTRWQLQSLVSIRKIQHKKTHPMLSN